MYGSTNCTQAALTKSAVQGGNIECDYIAKAKVDEFFNNFFIEEKIEFKSNILNIENSKSFNFSYQNNIDNTLYFSTKNQINNVKVLILDSEVNFEYSNTDLKIVVPLEILEKLSSIFTVRFEYDDKVENIKCYFNDLKQIEKNRNQELLNRIPNINISPDINAEPDKYLKDRIYLISRFGFMYDIFNEKLDYYVKDNESEDSEITDEKEDFIDYDYKLSTELQVKKKTLDQVIKANSYIFHSFREYMLSLATKNYSNNILERTNKLGVVKKTSRSATSDEKSFAKMVKNIANDLLNKTNSNKLDFSNYIQCVVAMFEIFNKFMIRENVLDMFDEKTVIDIQYKLIKELTQKLNNDITEEEKEMYLLLSLACILQVNYINTYNEKVDYKKNLFNRDLLNKIDEKFNIRESYDKYLEVSLGFINDGKERLDTIIAKSYIESLFEYRTESQINNLMDKNFGTDYEVEKNNDFVLIKIKANKIGNYFKLKDSIMKEIIKTYCNDESFKVLKLEITNVNINPDFPNPPIKIEYIFNKYGNGQQIITPKIGNQKVKLYNIR